MWECALELSIGVSIVKRETAMSWILIEAGLALALAIFIVWWTLPRSKGKNKNGNE